MAITSPVLLIDKEKCMNNLLRMKDKADRHELVLKPHVKTHQSADIGHWMKEAGIQAITVSSVRMGAYFAENGWNDITVAFPVNPLESDVINTLAATVDLSIMISDRHSVQLLNNKLSHPVHVYIEIDTGSERTGFTYDQIDTIQQVAKEIQSSPKLNFKGLYSHPGHSYRSRSKTEILKVHEEARKQMAGIRQSLYSLSDEDLAICLGDTPCCSVAENFEEIDEISPGNFIFYDNMQTHIGSCTYEDIAVVLAAPVVAVYPQRNEIAVHGGAIHLSKDHVQANGHTSYGSVVYLNSSGWSAPIEDAYVRKLSQEHGIISGTNNLLRNIQVGDLIGIQPVHSCLTADLMMGYQTLDGEELDHIRKHCQS